MSVLYRRAAAADACTLHRLLTQMAAEMGRAVAGNEAALVHHGFGPAPRFRAVLAERDGETLGFALMFPEYSSWRGAVGLYVQDLYVVPEARGTGIARALLAAAMDAAADWAPAYLTLMVDQGNDAARDWYVKQGFALRERGDLLLLEGANLDRLTQAPAP